MPASTHPFWHELRHLSREHRILVLAAMVAPLLGAADYLLYWHNAAHAEPNPGLGLLAEAAPWYILVGGLAAYRMCSPFRSPHADAAWRTTPVSYATLYGARGTLLALLFVVWPLFVVAAVARITWPETLGAQIFAVAVWQTFGLSAGAYLAVIKNGWARLLGALLALRTIQMLMTCWMRDAAFYGSDPFEHLREVRAHWLWLLLAGTFTLPLGIIVHQKLRRGRIRFITELALLVAPLVIISRLPEDGLPQTTPSRAANTLKEETGPAENLVGTVVYSHPRLRPSADLWIQTSIIINKPSSIPIGINATRVAEINEQEEHPLVDSALHNKNTRRINCYTSLSSQGDIHFHFPSPTKEFQSFWENRHGKTLKLSGMIRYAITQTTPLVKTASPGIYPTTINHQTYPISVTRSHLKESGKTWWSVGMDSYEGWTQILPWFGLTQINQEALGFWFQTTRMIDPKTGDTIRRAVSANGTWGGTRPLSTGLMPTNFINEPPGTTKPAIEIITELHRTQGYLTVPYTLTLKFPEKQQPNP